MALIFQVDDEGHARPKIRCDECGTVIENPSGSIATWDSQSAQPGMVVEPTFYCQHCKSKAVSAPRNAVPLDHFMLYLLNNMHLTPGVLEEAGRRLSD
jgi:DNA-directed RNA polymerase subunit RPC12/RpoP